MELRYVVGCNIMRLRKRNCNTCAGLAKKLNVEAGLVARWESGEAEPGFEMLERIAEVYRVSAASLLEDKPYSEYQEASLSCSDLIHHVCLAAASEYVAGTTIQPIGEEHPEGYRIELEISGYGYALSQNHDLIKDLQGMLLLVKAFSDGMLPRGIFEPAFDGVLDSYRKKEYAQGLHVQNIFRDFRKELANRFSDGDTEQP